MCAFDVVDNAEAPTKFVSCWILDGKTGQVVIPDPQPTPDPEPTPNPEPTPEPEPAPEPDISEDPVIPDTPALPSKEEVTKQIKEKEQKIKDLGLSQEIR